LECVNGFNGKNRKKTYYYQPLEDCYHLRGSCATSCPYGLVNDPYPGQCPRYTDLNGDGFCDFSQTSISMTTGTEIDETHQGDATDHTIENVDVDGVDYLIGLYLVTHYLFKRGYIRRSKHRKLWNLFLTFGYAGTGFTGFLSIFFIKLGTKTRL